jgi:hypothetical protein
MLTPLERRERRRTWCWARPTNRERNRSGHACNSYIELIGSDANEDPKKIEQDLMQVIPKDKWILFSHQIIWHGRRVCQARKPKCAECNLEMLCYSKDKTI